MSLQIMGEKMIQQKNENSEANLSHQSKSTISREQDFESEPRGKNLRESADGTQKIESIASARTESVNKGNARLNSLNYGENDLNCWRNDPQHGTESSCSNSLLSNHSRQETCKEVYSFRSESVERRSEEPAALVSTESDVLLAHVVGNAVRNAMKVSSVVGTRISLNTNEGNREKDIKSKNEPDNVIDVGVAALDREFTGEEFPGPSMVQSDKVSAGFDLNEDLNADEIDGPDEAMPSPEVIRVVAKAGVPRGSRLSPLKFEGTMGFTGSGKTSAFRNVAPSKPTNRSQEFFSGLDLNVASVEDVAAETQYIMSSASILQAPPADDDDDGARGPKRLKIDLNFSLCDPEEDGPLQLSVPPKRDNSPLVDLNANASTEEKSKIQSYGNQRDPRKLEFNYAGNNYWDGFRQIVGNNAHGQQYLVAAAPPPYVLQPVESVHRGPHLQPMLPLAPPNALPPQSYLSTVPFHFGPSNVRPHGTVPYVGFPLEQGFPPQMLYPGNVQQSLMAPPRLLNADIKSDENLAANGSKKMERGPFLFLGEDYNFGDRGEAWYGTSVRRKESDVGSSFHQLGHRW